MTSTNPDTAGLIERLRRSSDPKCHKAADALAAQEAEIARLEQRHYGIMLAICGGEDAPGYAATLGVEDVRDILDARKGIAEYDVQQAERALLDRLMEPSEGMVEVLYTECHRRGLIENYYDYDKPELRKSVQAMLTQFRKESGL